MRSNKTRYERRFERQIILTAVLTIITMIVLASFCVAHAEGTSPISVFTQSMTTPVPIESWG